MQSLLCELGSTLDPYCTICICVLIVQSLLCELGSALDPYCTICICVEWSVFYKYGHMFLLGMTCNV